MKNIFFRFFLALSIPCFAQFAPPVGQLGTTAMYKDSSSFVAWAQSCKIIRGLQNVSIPSNGNASVGDSSSVFGIAGTTGVVSLGDGGIAIVGFENPINDEQGFDFAVFENSFDDLFLELAFVEASSDGIHFFKFPAISNTDTVNQINSFDYLDATKLNNLAGKYRGLYGTPFDVADLPNSSLLNKQAITYIKIIDVVGCMQNQFCSRDAMNQKVNDPWPTSFSSGGFDLDAVGVIHQKVQVGINELNHQSITFYPNPANSILTLQFPSATNWQILIQSVQGQTMMLENFNQTMTTLNINDYPAGIYIITLSSLNTRQQLKFVKL